jgi:hypothetical protein
VGGFRVFCGPAARGPIIADVRSEALHRQAYDDSVGMIYDLEPDSGRMIIAFAAMPGQLAVRHFAFLTMLAEIDVKVAFLRDHFAAWYHRGVHGVGDSIDAVAEFLRDFRRNAAEVVMIGGSSGAYAAVLFGSLVACEVHAFSPQTFIDPELRRQHGDKRFPNEIAGLGSHMDMRYADLKPLVARAEAPVNVYYSTGHPLDSLHAERLGELGNVTLHGFHWDSHLLLRELRDRGWLEPFLDRLVHGNKA